MNYKFVLVLFLMSLSLVGCDNLITATPDTTPTITLITPEPTMTTTPTNTHEPTVTQYPTATPVGWELTITPTQIVLDNVPDALLLVVVDPGATDGLMVRSGPGYECSEDTPACNWIESVFPSDDIFILLEVDTSDTIAWCHYTANFSLGTTWSACQYLKPATSEDCQVAIDLDYDDELAECET
jgi:hypothetical protein